MPIVTYFRIIPWFDISTHRSTQSYSLLSHLFLPFQWGVTAHMNQPLREFLSRRIVKSHRRPVISIWKVVPATHWGQFFSHRVGGLETCGIDSGMSALAALRNSINQRGPGGNVSSNARNTQLTFSNNIFYPLHHRQILQWQVNTAFASVCQPRRLQSSWKAVTWFVLQGRWLSGGRRKSTSSFEQRVNSPLNDHILVGSPDSWLLEEPMKNTWFNWNDSYSIATADLQFKPAGMVTQNPPIDISFGEALILKEFNEESVNINPMRSPSSPHANPQRTDRYNPWSFQEWTRFPQQIPRSGNCCNLLRYGERRVAPDLGHSHPCWGQSDSDLSPVAPSGGVDRVRCRIFYYVCYPCFYSSTLLAASWHFRLSKGSKMWKGRLRRSISKILGYGGLIIRISGYGRLLPHPHYSIKL